MAEFQETIHLSDPEVLCDRPETYLTNWSTGDSRWLRRFHDADHAEPPSEKWGTIVKLFEYGLPAGGRSNILMADGLMRRTDLLLPDTALPIRFYEARKGYGEGMRVVFQTR